MKAEPRRQLCLYTAESVAWYWGVRQDRANVLMIDFNIDAEARIRQNNAWGRQRHQEFLKPAREAICQRPRRTNRRSAPTARTPTGWCGLSAVTENSSDVSGKRAAILFSRTAHAAPASSAIRKAEETKGATWRT